jgi:hypothetical protein
MLSFVIVNHLLHGVKSLFICGLCETTTSNFLGV